MYKVDCFLKKLLLKARVELGLKKVLLILSREIINNKNAMTEKIANEVNH